MSDLTQQLVQGLVLLHGVDIDVYIKEARPTGQITEEFENKSATYNKLLKDAILSRTPEELHQIIMSADGIDCEVKFDGLIADDMDTVEPGLRHLRRSAFQVLDTYVWERYVS